MRSRSGPDELESTEIGWSPSPNTYAVVLLKERVVEVLPSSGTVTIGRSRAAGICIDHPSVSREHAVLDVDAMTVTDVGSRNGTRIVGERLAKHAPASLIRGEPIIVGDVTILVHQDGASGPVVSGDIDIPLEVRLAEEAARAARQGTPFVHARIHVPVLQAQSAREVLLDALRTSDVLTEDGPGRFQLLLPAITSERGQPVVERLVTMLGRNGIAARSGIACYPHDGVTPAQLSAHARERLATGTGETALDEIYQLAASVADSDMTVLVTGETGVGKELIAEMIHRISPRARGPFVRINCAAIADALLESELFGHVRGAFTGADATRIGIFEAAAGGTVLLDEIGEMSLRLQASLLRVLEERAVRRVGESHARTVDVRIVCATNRSLENEVRAERFRGDLYYRISGVAIEIPPLRERPHAIEAIARAFAALAAARTPRATPAFTDDAIRALCASPWPGNVRQLRNAVERAVLLSGGRPIGPAELGLLRSSSRTSSPTLPIPCAEASASPSQQPPERPSSSALAELERKRIVETLDMYGGNQTRAARALGLSRTTLVARMDAYGLRRPRK